MLFIIKSTANSVCRSVLLIRQLQGVLHCHTLNLKPKSARKLLYINMNNATINSINNMSHNAQSFTGISSCDTTGQIKINTNSGSDGAKQHCNNGAAAGCINNNNNSEAHCKSVGDTCSRKVFVHTLNPTLGSMEWEVQDEDYDYTQEVARSAYADMLHDDQRNELYYAGLRDAVATVRSRGETVRVLDIGTGTGLLSMMAVTCGADVVTACEAFEPMAGCAERILAANNMADKVRVVHKRSTELQVGPGLDLDQRANVLVAEVFDTELIGEGAIGTYSHAMEHLLTPDALLVPSAARVYAQVVSSPKLHSYSRPNSHIPSQFAGLKLPESVAACPGSMSVHDLQMSQLPRDWYTPVSHPLTVFQFDWSGRTKKLGRNETTHTTFQPITVTSSQIDSEADIVTRTTTDSNMTTTDSKTTTNSTTTTCDRTTTDDHSDDDQYRQKTHQQQESDQQELCHAVLMWWDLTMDQSGDVMLTCAPHWLQPGSEGPGTVPWRDHWMQAVYHLPSPVPPSSGAMTLTAARDEYSMWFSVAEGKRAPVIQAPHCSCGVHMTTSRTRMAQLSDRRRLTVLVGALDDALQQQPGTAWLLLGDAINLLIVGKLARDARTSHVYVHDPSQQRPLQQFLAANGLEGRVTLLQQPLADTEVLRHRIGVVFSEPHFNTSLLPWHNLRANILLCQSAGSLLPPYVGSSGSVHTDDACQTNGVSNGVLHSNGVVHTNGAGHDTDSTLRAAASLSTPRPATHGRSTATAAAHHSSPVTAALVLPGTVALYCMPVSFLHLWKIRAPCGQRCGFDLTIFDEMIDRARCRTDDYVEAQPLWEYPCYSLHAPIHLTTLDLTHDITNLTVDVSSCVSLDVEALTQTAQDSKAAQRYCVGAQDTTHTTQDTTHTTQDTTHTTEEATHTTQETTHTTQKATQTPGSAATTSTAPVALHYNGVVMWAEWRYGAHVLATGPVERVRPGTQVVWDPCSQQGVHLPRRTVPLLPDSKQKCNFYYSLKATNNGEITFSFDLKDSS